MTLLSSTLMAKTETITEEVCNAPAGCRIEMTTGVCIGCVTITRTIVTKDPISLVEEKTKTIDSVDVVSKDRKSIARCWAGCLSADAAIRGYMFEGKYWRLLHN